MFGKLALARSFSKLQKTFPVWNIVRGDKVAVVSGHDKGKSGVVKKVYRKTNRVLIQGVNLKVKKVKSQLDGESKGGLLHTERPLHISNVNLVDPSSNLPTRTQSAYTKTGRKVRISKRSGKVIPKPSRSNLKYAKRTANKMDGPMNTPSDVVMTRTYFGEDFDQILADFNKQIKKKEHTESLLVFDK